MDEIGMFTALRPAPPAEPDRIRRAARDRLDTALAGSQGGRRLRGRRRLIALAAGVAVVAGAAVVVPTILAGGASSSFVTSAWAVQRSPDGTIAVTFKDAGDPSGLQRTLRADGVAAYVRHLPATSTCAYRQAGGPAESGSVAQQVLSPPASPDAVTIHPSAMPKGTAVLIQVYEPGPGTISVHASVMGNDRPPVCVPFAHE